jgi:hypothetical protein
VNDSSADRYDWTAGRGLSVGSSSAGKWPVPRQYEQRSQQRRRRVPVSWRCQNSHMRAPSADDSSELSQRIKSSKVAATGASCAGR